MSFARKYIQQGISSGFFPLTSIQPDSPVRYQILLFALVQKSFKLISNIVGDLWDLY